MTNISDKPADPQLLDTPHAPDFFADGGTGFFLLNGNLRITLESIRVSHITDPGPVNRVVIGRLVMPINAAEALAKQILAFAEKSRSAADQTTAQGTPTVH